MVATFAAHDIGDLSRRFAAATPVKHVWIEGVLAPEFAQCLVREFPPFRPEAAINEFGTVGLNAVTRDIKAIGPHFAQLYDHFLSREFIGNLEAITGIDGLLPDPELSGAGTHNNLHGMDLDPHVDFNIHNELHRRLNVLIYLNDEWESAWGGEIELHSDPWGGPDNEIRRYDCRLNHCLIFETNEKSWHGFRPINLPEHKRHLSRKSVSIYLYSKDRSSDEIAPPHGTFFVPWPLPDHLQVDRVLTKDDVETIRRLTAKRDNWLKFYHRLEIEKNRHLSYQQRHMNQLRDSVRVPCVGDVLQVGKAEGYSVDGWVENSLTVNFRSFAELSKLRIFGGLVGSNDNAITVSVGTADTDGAGVPSAVITTSVDNTRFPVEITLPTIPAQRRFKITITMAKDYVADEIAGNGDTRRLSLNIRYLQFVSNH
jgi:hypothetical protein